MVVSDKHRYVYIAIPRTASKSIVQWLAAHYDGHVVGKHHACDVPQRCKDYLVWTVVRNPYDRAVSGYYAAHHASDKPAPAEGRTFLEYMTLPMAMTAQADVIKRAGVQLVLYYEHLPFCLSSLPFVGDAYPDLERVAEKSHRPPADFAAGYGEGEPLVWHWAKDDFEMLGYRRIDTGFALCRWITKP